MGKTLYGVVCVRKDEEVYESPPFSYGWACFMCLLERDSFGTSSNVESVLNIKEVQVSWLCNRILETQLNGTKVCKRYIFFNREKQK